MDQARLIISLQQSQQKSSKQNLSFKGKYRKIHSLSSSNEKKYIIKIEKKLQNPYLTN